MTLQELQRLSGISSVPAPEGSNISITGSEKARIQRERGIKPGTPEWFQLWFSLPLMTGEKPTGPTGHR